MSNGDPSTDCCETGAAATYAQELVRRLPHVLGMMDRDDSSRTVGCGDRSYWAWKFVDFAGARFQESVCVLSYAFAQDLPTNPYFQNERLLRWIAHALTYWSDLQHGDGSFDEAYPYERSLAATAFTAFYVGEALRFLGDRVPGEAAKKARDSLARAGQWLIRNDETHGFLSNHLSAAAAALYHAYLLTGDRQFERRSNYFVDRILAHQSEEGWYEEYGGADPGYQTHGAFYLARIWQFTQDPRLLHSLSNSSRFLAHFVHADGSFSGEYASRNTQTYYPAVFEMLAHVDDASAWIAETMRPSLATRAAAMVATVDQYNLYPCLNNLVFAHQAVAHRLSELEVKQPEQPDFCWFPKAGLGRVRHDVYEAFVGATKGGVLKVFDRRTSRLVCNDCGYIGRLRNGKLVATQVTTTVIQVRADSMEIHGQLAEVSRPHMTPYLFAGFRAFMLTIGRFPVLARWLKHQLVRVLIYRRRPLDIHFTRRIEFGKETIVVADYLRGPDGKSVEELQWCELFSTIHMGSARYFVPSELEENLAVEDQSGAIPGSELVHGAARRRTIQLP